ncbi:MAG: extracellular solute-binding protein [Pseudomonadota bacterium]|nr:extracellular solute-binding protein [Pseudomonadota bacterium]
MSIHPKFLLVAMFLFACLGQTQASVAAEVNIYSHRQPFLIKPFLRAFKEKTGIKTNVVYASKGLVQRLLAEGEASPADVVLTVDIGRLRQYADKNLFASFASEKLRAAIPRHLRSSDNTWFGFSKRSRVIVVSKDLENQDQIKRFENIADKRWNGQVCSRPGSHVYNRALLSSVIAANGKAVAKAWAEGMVANLARSPRGNDRAQIKAIYAGECGITIVNHYYYGKLINSSNSEERRWAESVNIIIPNQGENDRGAHINISGGGIAKYSKNRKEAERFLEFLISEEAQKLYASINYEYPVISDVELPDTLTSWGKFKEDSLPIEELANSYLEAQMIIDQVGW